MKRRCSSEGWGEGEFRLPHGIAADPEDHLYLVDVGGHEVQKRTREGEVLFTLVDRDRKAPLHSGRPFNRPTDIVVHPETGDLFVSDGYGNSTVHRFTAGGTHVASFGRPDSDPAEFSLPHGVCFLGAERLVVCDRENFCLQVFTLDGEPLEQWHHYYPQAVRSVCGAAGAWRVFVGGRATGPLPAPHPEPQLPGEGPRCHGHRGRPGRGRRQGLRGRPLHLHPRPGRRLPRRPLVAECPYMTLTRYYEEEAPPGELLPQVAENQTGRLMCTNAATSTFYRGLTGPFTAERGPPG